MFQFVSHNIVENDSPSVLKSLFYKSIKELFAPYSDCRIWYSKVFLPTWSFGWYYNKLSYQCQLKFGMGVINMGHINFLVKAKVRRIQGSNKHEEVWIMLFIFSIPTLSFRSSMSSRNFHLLFLSYLIFWFNTSFILNLIVYNAQIVQY